MRVACVFCMAALVVGQLSAPRSGAAETVILKDAMQRWKETQARVHSAEFKWTTRHWMKQGAIARVGAFPLNSDTPVPEKDITLEYKRIMTFRDGLVRYKSDGPVWDRDQKQFVEDSQDYAWNGESGIRLDADELKPYAFVYGANQQLTQNEVRPIQFAFRMLHPDWYVFKPEEYEIGNPSATIRGLHCLVVETARRLVQQKVARGRRPLKAVFWVCPERDFSVVRYAAVDEAIGSPTLEFEIDHTLDAESGAWIPSRWTITTYGKEGPLEIETSTVEHYAINPQTLDEVFQLELPANTMVSDLRTGEDYIQRANGEKRIITREELVRGATYEDLVGSATGNAGLRRSNERGWFSLLLSYIWAVGLLLVVTAAVVAIRRRMG